MCVTKEEKLSNSAEKNIKNINSNTRIWLNFFVLLTVHLSIILENDQLSGQILVL